MRQRLTDLSIKQLPIPDSGSQKYWDTQSNGFGIRVSQGGSKSFVVMYGKDRRLKTIGRYPAMTLKTARREARMLLTSQTSPQSIRTLEQAKSAFLVDCERRNRTSTIKGYAHYLKALNKRYLDDVKLTDIPQSGHYIATAKMFYNWCIRNELTDRNPFIHEKVTYGQRDRVLNDEEIKAVWDYNYPPFSDYVRLMLLTGFRRGECVHVQKREDTLYIAGDNTKNKRPLTVPMTSMTDNILPIDYFNGWSKGKARMDKHITIPHWTLHDLRRTFATVNARLGAPIHVVEAMLNHSSGTISGVAAIYIRHNFLIEMRDALNVYEIHLKKVIA